MARGRPHWTDNPESLQWRIFRALERGPATRAEIERRARLRTKSVSPEAWRRAITILRSEGTIASVHVGHRAVYALTEIAAVRAFLVHWPNLWGRLPESIRLAYAPVHAAMQADLALFREHAARRVERVAKPERHHPVRDPKRFPAHRWKGRDTCAQCGLRRRPIEGRMSRDEYKLPDSDRWSRLMPCCTRPKWGYL